MRSTARQRATADAGTSADFDAGPNGNAAAQHRLQQLPWLLLLQQQQQHLLLILVAMQQQLPWLLLLQVMVAHLCLLSLV